MTKEGSPYSLWQHKVWKQKVWNVYTYFCVELLQLGGSNNERRNFCDGKGAPINTVVEFVLHPHFILQDNSSTTKTLHLLEETKI